MWLNDIVRKNDDGYVAITTVLIVGAVLLTVGVALTVNSINEAQSSLAEIKNEASLALVESCVQDGLLRINKSNSLPTTITLPQGMCDVTINSHIGNAWTFSVSGVFGGFTKNVQVSANRTSTIGVTNWQEM